VSQAEHGRGPAQAALLLVVALAGAATMTVELAAVRLLAPWFGASSGVWTNVIGVVLLALALGYMIGARLSARPNPGQVLGLVLLLGAILVAWLPALAAPVAGFFMPAGVALDQAAGLLSWGSLAASLSLFGPAAVMLGCVGPLAVECLAREGDTRAGDAGGRVLAGSTLGSLVGTFATTHLFLPSLGLNVTFLAAGGVLAALGLLLRGGLGGKFGPLLILPTLVALGMGRFAPPAVAEGMRLLEARQSAYQALRVVESGAGTPEHLRMLQVNESFDSFQSVWKPEPGLLGPGYYYDQFVAPVWWSQDQADKQWDLLVLGLGAGTTVRVLEGLLPTEVKLYCTGIEIDPEVVALGIEWFGLESKPPTRVVHGDLDARAALNLAAGPFDQVVLDTYANNMEVPPHLCTTEFFAEVKAKLAPGGWLTVNAAGFGLDDPVVAALASTLAHGFGSEVLLMRVPFSRNCIIHARRAEDVPKPGSQQWVVGNEQVDRLLAAFDLPGSWSVVQPPESAPLTDNLNPMERLQLESISQGRARWVEGLR
jgi:predicted membrane-bound spermidine synthase